MIQQWMLCFSEEFSEKPKTEFSEKPGTNNDVMFLGTILSGRRG